MNILFITQRKILPLTDGALIGSYGLLKYLKELGLNTTLVSFYDKDNYSRDEKDILSVYVDAIFSCKLHWKNTSLNLSFKYPNTIRKHTRSNMKRLLRRIKNTVKFDIVIIDHLQMFEYSKIFADRRIILHNHNVESNLWNEYSLKGNAIVKILLKRNARMMYEYESNALRKSNAVIAVSDKDKFVFKQMYENVNCTVMHSYNKYDVIKTLKDNNITKKIIFVGSYGWYPNQSAARFLALEVMPRLRLKVNGIMLYLVGKDPTNEIKNFSSEDVVVTGTVDSVDPYLKNADVFVNAVTEGSGINIKVIEAMGKGIPIVSSIYGMRGFEIKEDVPIALLYNNVDECVENIVKLLNDRKLAITIARNARTYYEEFITPSDDVKAIFLN